MEGKGLMKHDRGDGDVNTVRTKPGVSGRVDAAFHPGSNYLRVTRGFCSHVCPFHSDVVTKH